MNLLEFAKITPETSFKASDFEEVVDKETFLIVAHKNGEKYGLSKTELTEDIADKTFRVFTNSRGEKWLTSKPSQEIKSRF